MSSRGRTRPLSEGRRDGGGVGGEVAFPHYLERRGLGMQLTWTRPAPLTCQSGRECVLDLCWPVGPALHEPLSVLLRTPAAKFSQDMSLFLNIFFFIYTFTFANLLYWRFIKYYTFKSSPPSMHHVLLCPASAGVSDRAAPALYFTAFLALF